VAAAACVDAEFAAPFASSSANCIFVVIDDGLGFALQAKRHARGRLDLALASLVRSAGYWPK
jgi:hypothetical protein